MVWLLTVVVFIWGSSSQAYFSVMDVGTLTQKGRYKALAQVQGAFGDNSRQIGGVNINGRFSTGFNESTELQLEVGAGGLGSYLGFFGKWIPIPDVEGQPAVGLRSGFTLIQVNDLTIYGLNITPLVSKEMEFSGGLLTPYAAFPVGLQNTSENDFYISLQLALGVQWTPDEWDFEDFKNMTFFFEYISSSSQAFSSMNGGVTYIF